MAKLIGIAALAVLPIPATILALAFVNLLALSALLGTWIFVPDLGSWLYTACWVNIVGMRVLQKKFTHSPLSKRFPTSTTEQNRSAATLGTAQGWTLQILPQSGGESLRTWTGTGTMPKNN